MSGHSVYTKEQIFVTDFPVGGKMNASVTITDNTKPDFLKVKVTRNNKKLLFPENMTFLKIDLKNPKIGDSYFGEFILRKTKKNLFFLETSSSEVDLVFPKTKKEIILYLRKNFKGFGEKKSEKIVDYLGLDCLSIISRNPDILDDEKLKLSKKEKETLRAGLFDGEILNRLLVRLSYFGLNEKIAFDLYQKFGNSTLKKLEENPWCLTDVSPLFFKKSEEIFKQQILENTKKIKYKILLKSKTRYRAAIKFFLKSEVEESGSLCEEYNNLIQKMKLGFINENTVFKDIKANFPDEEILKEVLDELVESKDLVVKKNKKKESVYYLSEAYIAENLVIKSIKKFNKKVITLSSEKLEEEFIEVYEKRNNIKLANNQKKAISLLPNNKISILTGGPGTGKTNTLKAIKEYLDFLEKRGQLSNSEISLLAPTGKAARRMSEVLKIDASTIHRKLKISGFGRSTALEKIKERFVIVDESSMMDVYLFSKLLDSLSEDTNLLLVGDENQLPSVGPGLILRDLIASGNVKTIKLNEVFRQGKDSALIKNAEYMNKGEDIIPNNNKYIFDKQFNPIGDSYFINTTTHDIPNKILQILNLLINKNNYNRKDILILSGQKNGLVGVKRINRLVQEYINPNIKNQNISAIRKNDTTIFSIGDPVIQTVNDYNKEVFNGEIGEVIDIEYNKNGEKIIVVNFPDDELLEKTVYYKGIDVYNLELAYCITYHKSQGSESPIVIQIVDQTQNKVLNRSLIYTGYTRTKSTNFLIGDISAFNIAINNTENLKRNSLIKEKL